MNRFLPGVVARSSAFQRSGLVSASRLAIALSLVTIPSITGCSAMKVKLGMRVALAKTPVLSMAASLPNNPGIAPGEKSPLVVEVTDATGKVLVTEGKGKGKVQWKDLVVTPTVVSVNKKGVLSLPRDPRVSDGKTGHITITVPTHPGIQTLTASTFPCATTTHSPPTSPAHLASTAPMALPALTAPAERQAP